MAAYSVVQKYLVDDFAVLVLLTPAEIEVGASVVVTNVDATFNGTYTFYSIRLSRSRIKSFTQEQPTTLNESPRLELSPSPRRRHG
jgi:hypothetical protein